MAGEEVVQLYIEDTNPAHHPPIHSLAGFARIALRPGERKTVQFAIAAHRFSTVSANGRGIVEPGAFEIPLGGQQAGAAAATLRISGAAKELN